MIPFAPDVTLRPVMRCNFNDLAAYLCMSQKGYHRNDGPLPDWQSRIKVAKVIMATALAKGTDNTEGWADYMEDEDADLVRAWADQTVAVNFPELHRPARVSQATA